MKIDTTIINWYSMSEEPEKGREILLQRNMSYYRKNHPGINISKTHILELSYNDDWNSYMCNEEYIGWFYIDEILIDTITEKCNKTKKLLNSLQKMISEYITYTDIYIKSPINTSHHYFKVQFENESEKIIDKIINIINSIKDEQ